jgi:type II secretion system protein I
MTKRGPAAFMLIEAVVATMILAVGLMGVFSAIHASMEVGEVSRESGMAGEVAQSKMSEIELSPESALGTKEGAVAAGERSYSWQTTVAQTKDSDLLSARVTVTYLARGVQRQLDLTTLLRQRSGSAQ